MKYVDEIIEDLTALEPESAWLDPLRRIQKAVSDDCGVELSAADFERVVSLIQTKRPRYERKILFFR